MVGGGGGSSTVEDRGSGANANLSESERVRDVGEQANKQRVEVLTQQHWRRRVDHIHRLHVTVGAGGVAASMNSFNFSWGFGMR